MPVQSKHQAAQIQFTFVTGGAQVAGEQGLHMIVVNDEVLFGIIFNSIVKFIAVYFDGAGVETFFKSHFTDLQAVLVFKDGLIVPETTSLKKKNAL